MSDIKLGNVPSSTLNDTSNFIFTDGENVRKETYANVKTDMIGSTDLTTTAQKPKEAINELNQDLLESTGYGVINGGVVSAQSTPNMTVQVTECTLKTSIGARQIAVANANISITAADTTNPRIDIVYVDSTGIVQYLQGTAAVSPTAPTTPTGGFLLYEINVAANASSITNSNIVDKRKIKNTTDLLATKLLDKVNNTDLKTVALSGLYKDLTNKPIDEAGLISQALRYSTVTRALISGSNTFNIVYSELFAVAKGTSGLFSVLVSGSNYNIRQIYAYTTVSNSGCIVSKLCEKIYSGTGTCTVAQVGCSGYTTDDTTKGLTVNVTGVPTGGATFILTPFFIQ